MELSAYLHQMYDYHYWATRRLLAALQNMQHEELVKPRFHSWGSIHGLLLHMLTAEWLWLQRWQGVSPSALLSADEYPTLDAIAERWSQQEREMRLYIGSQTGESVDRIVEYLSTQGEPMQAPLWQLLLHVANHGTHHRGELAVVLAELNVPHPEDDILYYFREISEQNIAPAE